MCMDNFSVCFHPSSDDFFSVLCCVSVFRKEQSPFYLQTKLVTRSFGNDEMENVNLMPM